MKKVLKPEEKTMEKIVALCKNRGYVYPGSEIYGGLSNSWDYGPLGCLFKDNVKNAWKRKFVQESRYNVALDSAILMNPEVWVATGHVGGFSDPLMDCKDCKTRHRADKLIEDFTGESADGWTNEQMQQFIADNNIACPECGGHNFTDIRQFNLMFKTFQGVTEDAKSQLYLRPETAQGIFVNFPSIQRTTRKKVPFGVCQVGKSFSNEITPGNFIFRIREFEQMECEFFCKPGTDLDWFYYWKDFCKNWLLNLGHGRSRTSACATTARRSSPSTPRRRRILSICSRSAGASFGALQTARTMTSPSHQEHSGKDLSYFDPETNDPLRAVCRRAVSRRGPRSAGVPVRRLRRRKPRHRRKTGRARCTASAPGTGTV